MLPLVLTGCLHKSHKAPVQPALPPVAETPAPTPTPHQEPVTPPPAPTPEPAKPEPTPQESKPEPSKPKPPVHRKKPAPKPAAQQTRQGVSAIGQLSSGASDQRGQTLGTIASTERGLNNLNRRLNDQEQRTAAQIREFLKQARAALASGDIDGASTLAMKAKVLLGELSR